MKTLRALFVVLALSAVAIGTAPVPVRAETCSCTCTKQNGEQYSGGSQPTVGACSSKCNSEQYAGGGGATGQYLGCSAINCWCRDGNKDAYVKESDGSEAECKTLCTSLQASDGGKQQFAGWDNRPPARASGSDSLQFAVCPPGGIWKKEECVAGGGAWIPPEGNDKPGPYCYVNTPIEIKTQLVPGQTTVANLPEYIKLVYNLGLGAAAVLAVIMMMVGGFRWIVSAGGAQIAEAKKMIVNAIIGLLIAFSSFVILQTINPALTQLKLPRIQKIKACVLLADCSGYPNKEECEANAKKVPASCHWNANARACQDVTTVVSGTLGAPGGECTNGTSCSTGKCLTSLSPPLCTNGAACAPCATSSDCAKVGGIVPDCIDNKCATIKDGKQFRCSGVTCDRDDHCITGFCAGNSSPKRCGLGASGNDCTAGGEDACFTGGGYHCTQFDTTSQGSRKVCCLNASVGSNASTAVSRTLESCKGCQSDAYCPDLMFCMDTTRAKAYPGTTPETCYYDKPAGSPCNSGSMCASRVCKSDSTCQ